MVKQMRVTELTDFIQARYAITRARAAGLPKPWTQDPILQTYRFCNMHREDDTVTKWIAVNWRTPYGHDPNLWFAMAVARLINWPESLAQLSRAVFYGRIQPRVAWDSAVFNDVLWKRKQARQQVFNSAYIVSTNGRAMDKVEYLAARVLTPLWAARASAPVAVRPQTPLLELHNWLTKHDGLGSFMAGQVVADTKYQPMWRGAVDWWTFAASGPGSRRGLNWVYGRELDAPWREEEWRRRLTELQAAVDPIMERAKIPRLHAQDLQNTLCEVGKYVRGYSRSKYAGV